MPQSVLFDLDGAPLDALEAGGTPWGIVTNKPASLTEPLLRSLALDERAGVVVSGDTLGEKKPHPRPLLFAAERLGVQPQACAHVGDAERDMLAPHADWRQWPHEAVVDSLAEILPWLEAQRRRAARATP